MTDLDSVVGVDHSQTGFLAVERHYSRHCAIIDYKHYRATVNWQHLEGFEHYKWKDQPIPFYVVRYWPNVAAEGVTGPALRDIPMDCFQILTAKSAAVDAGVHCTERAFVSWLWRLRVLTAPASFLMTFSDKIPRWFWS
jgi:hypothetical protein